MPRAMALYFALALAASSAHAQLAKDWTEGDSAAAAAALGFLAMDWAQTRTIARNPHQFREYNPVLGPHPSVGRANWYFSGAMAGTIIAAATLPPNYRRRFLSTLLGFEAAIVITNHNAGISMRRAF